MQSICAVTPKNWGWPSVSDRKITGFFLAWKHRIPGLSLATGLGILSVALSRSGAIPFIGSIAIAILAGIVVGNIFPIDRLRPEGFEWSEKILLTWAIALLGLSLNLGVLSPDGAGSALALGTVVTVVAATIVMGLVISRMLGLPRSIGILLGVGNAVCGSSAILAVAPLATKDHHEIGVSVGVVNLLGTIGIFALPQLVALQGLDASAGGLLIGGSLQAVGHVVAAGFSISDQVGELATAVKMFRILLLGPIILVLGLLLHARYWLSWRQIPRYILAFILLAVVGNLGILSDELTGTIQTVTKLMLAIAMAGVGLRIRLAGLLKQGPRVLIAGALLFGVQLLLLSFLIRIQM
jgi:uncharacterized integral membrane protein (TIGR00698 family)